jgi:hypothetical protein
MKDSLGVSLFQNSAEEGEVNLIDSRYTKECRFAFTYSWWSGYGYKSFIQKHKAVASKMKLVDQESVYEKVGPQIKDQLLDGSAVVLFAYGLSGSGKTYTVFGPDAMDHPDAWFRKATPHNQWGIFPRLAYDIMQEKQDGWKVSMKYFQNVVDTVRDLMCPYAREIHYKTGMRKDDDGFTDITWCTESPITSWNDLRNAFLKSNARKAISSTQFNHHSTRGHCIMTLEVQKPHPSMPGMKLRGRIYICDLAGTEPAGDIVHGKYEKIYLDDGLVQYRYVGAHPDSTKTKELRDQGTKINLSLSEMAQFFMKMARAIKEKKLKPGKSIPGCNSYFLCKYLKDTMLQARTYLFCAIRPEKAFQAYTFSTLGFAKNASVIKLQPKKATTEMSPGERKLMRELEEMRELVKQLKEENKMLSSSSSHPSTPIRTNLLRLEAKLEEKQAELMNEVFGNDSSITTVNNEKEEYRRRGITLIDGEVKTDKLGSPFFVNLDEDRFLSHRYQYFISQEETSFGPGGDIRPTDFTVVNEHCKIYKDPSSSNCTLVPGNGDIWINGGKLEKNGSALLNPFDRIAMGHTLLLFLTPQNSLTSKDCPSAEFAASELRLGLMGSNSLDKERQRVQEEITRYNKEQKGDMPPDTGLGRDQSQNAKRQRKLQELEREKINRDTLIKAMPLAEELSRMFQLLSRSWLKCESIMSATYNEQLRAYEPQVRIKISNAQTAEELYMDPFELQSVHSILESEILALRSAFELGKDYHVPVQNDPIRLCYDHCFHLGTAIVFMEQLAYNLETDVGVEEEVLLEIANPGRYDKLGFIEAVWTPLSHPDEKRHDPGKVRQIMDPKDLIGKSFTYKLQLFSMKNLRMKVSSCYCQYNFFGETFTTERIENLDTDNPALKYECIHHVDKVTKNFLNYLAMDTLKLNIFVQPVVQNSTAEPLSTKNRTLASSLGAYSVVGAENSENATLKKKVNQLEKHNKTLIKLVEEMRFLLPDEDESNDTSSDGRKSLTSRIKERIDTAIKVDRELNNTKIV